MEEKIKDIDKCLLEKITPGEFNPLSPDITESIFNSINGGLEDQNSSACKEGKSFQDLRENLSLLSLPPKFTTLRVNLQRTSLKESVTVIEQHLGDKQDQGYEAKPRIYPHHVIPDLIVIESSGLKNVCPKSEKDVIVGRLCGASVLRGADVYAPGVLGMTPGLLPGEQVAVYADLDDKCLRGEKSFKGRKMFVGNGSMIQNRRDIFKIDKPVGLAVAIDEKIFDCPNLGDFRKDIFFLQNLPSVLCSHILNPAKNSVVLDMCAAPGGKTTHLASLVGPNGKVIAIDRVKTKISQIRENAEHLGLNNIHTFVYDSTKLINEAYEPGVKKPKMTEDTDNVDSFQKPSLEFHPPYSSFSFDWILLDAPCSALGQRPQIQKKCSLKELKSYPIMQKMLLASAIKLLSLNGKLVYSTCTIVPEENEMVVKWVLDHFKCMKLVNQNPVIGKPGLPNCGLSIDQCQKVQRFGPVVDTCMEQKLTLNGPNNDTIGFFIASFRKVSHL